MTGYVYFSNVLIRGLVLCIVGLKIADVDITCPTYAEDMVVMGTNVAALQVLLTKSVSIQENGTCHSMQENVLLLYLVKTKILTMI